ncbi:MAG: tRNA pseudouridine(55) synthase TruB [Clostridia bacterium]|nr:tRNA pseudouridine(55) synthase TruB [Clostridia bacterium]
MNMQLQEPSGVLIVHKHEGLTSHDVVNQIRRLYHTRKVGHTGTLDPMATGVLVVLIGRAAKASEYLVTDQKRYLATLRLGLTTDTEDTTGTVLTTNGRTVTEEDLQSVLPRFRGVIEQIPPMYSALKVNGQKLVDLARRGETVERKPRKIEILALSAEKTEIENEFRLDVTCSGGTYIRTLCADIGAALDVGGAMASLCRLETGGFSLSQAHTMQALSEMTDEERLALLIPIEQLFVTLDAVKLPAFFERLCRGGCEIYQKKIGTHHALGTRVRLCREDGQFFALGEVGEYPDGSAIKAIKTFELE